eukprot:795682_1
MATKLYQELHLFQLQSITPSTIFTVYLDDDTNIEKERPCEMDIFAKWTAIMTAQYNDNRPFNQRVFNHFIETYRKNPNQIIKMKYDNYAKDLNQKTYDDVLKSFTSWSVTTKCD